MAEALRQKHTKALTRLLHVSVLRKDTARALQCCSLLVRTKGHKLREIWSLCLEALGSANARAQQEFLEWLIVEYPVKPNRRLNLRADTFYPALLLAKLHSDVPDAIDRLEEILLEHPYSEDGRLHAFLAMALLYRDRPTAHSVESCPPDVRKAFAQAAKLGYTDVPEQLMFPPRPAGSDDGTEPSSADGGSADEGSVGDETPAASPGSPASVYDPAEPEPEPEPEPAEDDLLHEDNIRSLQTMFW
ncbi:uncharacterized protein V1510DRAFT_417541 [Dipodascopsis tothii]|uniref:uncharacterized protein n=1 Tax=Dipodascopsis tothii TaxID=44089 RepID=UPI0034CEA33C